MTDVLRGAEIERRTGETQVRARLDLDGTGEATIATGVPFLDHMLSLFGRHGRFDLTVEAAGDTHVDNHHTVEDVGIVLGMCLREALGDKVGIARYGFAYAPMDEALARSVVDLSGRAYCVFEAPIPAARIGSFETELVEHFCVSLAFNALMNLHVDLIRGRNAHHVVEAVFKSMALALHQATRLVRADLPSTKGTL